MTDNIKLPPMPETDWKLHMPAQQYEAAWTSTESGYTEADMESYAREAVRLNAQAVPCDCTTEIHADGTRKTWCGSDQMRRATEEGHAFAAAPAAPQPAQQPLFDDHDESELPESLFNEVDAWFAHNTGLGGCSDKDVSELAGIFFSVTYGGGRESVDAALAVVDSFGPGVDGLNDTYARQVLLAQEVRRLRNALRTADEQQEGNSND